MHHLGCNRNNRNVTQLFALEIRIFKCENNFPLNYCSRQRHKVTVPLLSSEVTALWIFSAVPDGTSSLSPGYWAGSENSFAKPANWPLQARRRPGPGGSFLFYVATCWEAASTPSPCVGEYYAFLLNVRQLIVKGEKPAELASPEGLGYFLLILFLGTKLSDSFSFPI